VEHHGQVHAGDTVDHRVVHLPHHRGIAVGAALDDDELPQRMIAVEHAREGPAADLRKHPVIPRRRQRHLDHVVADVERRIVLPGRMGHREEREHHLLPVPRQEVEAVFQGPHQRVEREPPFVDHGAAIVHGLSGLLRVEEGRVDRREATVQRHAGSGVGGYAEDGWCARARWRAMAR